MRLVEALVRMPAFHAFAFTPEGRHVARLVDRDGTPIVETRDLGNGRPPERIYEGDPALSVDTQLSFPSTDLVRIYSGRGGWFQIVEAHRGDAGDEWTAEPIADCEVATLRLLPRLREADWDLAISCTDDGLSTIWRIEHDRPRLRPLVRVPGVLGEGAWVERGRRLAINIKEPGRPASGYVIDLVGRTYHRWFHISDDSNDRIMLCDPDRGLLVVASDCWGHHRVGVADLALDQKVRFFPDLPGEDRSVDPCGFYGCQLVLRRHRGVVNELWLADPAKLTVSGPLRLPNGIVGQPIICAGDRIRFPFTAPTVPGVCASYLLAQNRFLLDEPPNLGGLSEGQLVKPRLVRIPGPHGDIEALVYHPHSHGGRDLVVVALHGGPFGQWSMAFTPELQLLVGLGAVVVAPNYHGSVGYGDEFARVLKGAAGTVEVDDVVAVIRAARAAVGSPRTATVVYGHSYGAFLALLLAATYPGCVDGVIAVAPFMSLSSIRAVGAAPVRRLVDLLRDPRLPEEEIDLLRRCRNVRARLLIAHGGRDEVVPIEQSHALCAQLRAHGYRDGRELWFLPLPEEGHTITSREGARRLYRQIELFVSGIATERYEGQRRTLESDLNKEQDVAGRRPPRAMGPSVLCDATAKGGDRE